MKYLGSFLAFGFLLVGSLAAEAPSQRQLDQWLKRFPAADTNEDGKLTLDEALAYRDKLRGGSGKAGRNRQRGAPRNFEVDPGWDEERFPEHAMCYQSPEQIAEVYRKSLNGKGKAITSYEKPESGALRIVGTGHSFMAPGYRTLPQICQAAGFDQPLLTHTGGGVTGSTRYKWEQENGIFQFDGQPIPKLMASIANAEWDAMMWGPYFHDRIEFYQCWIDFCLKYNPDMKFFLSDAWPQLYQLEEKPETEAFFTEAVIEKMGRERHGGYAKLVEALREQYSERIFILPTSDAMVLAAKRFLRGELPQVEGLHSAVGEKEERALWRDELGHLGPGFDRLEGYVFYATLYGRSPVLIEEPIPFRGSSAFPGPELDGIFREIAWQAVIGNPLSGVVDKDGDGVGDEAAELEAVKLD